MTPPLHFGRSGANRLPPFPYYNGAPTAISTAHWLFVLAMVVAGFMVLASPIDWPGGT